MDDITDPFTAQIEQQKEAAVEKTRNWLRGWDADQREMINFEHEDGSKTESEKVN